MNVPFVADYQVGRLGLCSFVFFLPARQPLRTPKTGGLGRDVTQWPVVNPPKLGGCVKYNIGSFLAVFVLGWLALQQQVLSCDEEAQFKQPPKPPQPVRSLRNAQGQGQDSDREVEKAPEAEDTEKEVERRLRRRHLPLPLAKPNGSFVQLNGKIALAKGMCGGETRRSG